jgi:hypothetical protein
MGAYLVVKQPIGMSGGFRRCYDQGLLEDPTMKGSVRLTVRIGPGCKSRISE